MIFRLTWFNGHVISPQEDVMTLVLRHLQKAEILVPGLYNLTPAHWTKNTHHHRLIVRADGTAQYYLAPVDGDVGYVVYNHQGNAIGFTAGEGRIELPRDQTMAFLCGPSKSLDGSLSVYVGIIWTSTLAS